MPSKLTIGLTGGVASGKSVVEGMLTALGVAVLDADQVSRDVVAVGSPALTEIARTFGSDMLLPDGSLDRRRMRARVFADADARKQLEAITHPLIRARIVEWLARRTGAYCVLSVAILVESGMRALVDRVLVVDVPEDLQLQRLCARDAVTPELAQQMLVAQATRNQRLAAADDVIVNAADLDALRASVEELHRFYLQLSDSGNLRAPGLRLPASMI